MATEELVVQIDEDERRIVVDNKLEQHALGETEEGEIID